MRYFYKKYNVVKDNKYIIDYLPASKSSESSFQYTVYNNITIDEHTGKISVSSKNILTSNSNNRTKVYTRCGNLYYECHTNSISGQAIYLMYDSRIDGKLQSYDKKGSYIDTITSKEKIYPDNGKHIDGYWYVKDKPITIKFLLKDLSNNLYTLNPNLINLDTQTLTEAIFKNEGFDDTNLIKSLSNKQNYKILIYINDKTLTGCNMIYNYTPFRPINKFKQLNDGKFNVIMTENN